MSEDGYIKGKKQKKPMGPTAPHYPAKKEAELLRRLMAETGKTEEQIRAIKKYRVMLSATQKQEADPDKRRKVIAKRIARYYAEKLSLLPTDPAVQKKVQEELSKLPAYARTWRSTK